MAKRITRGLLIAGLAAALVLVGWAATKPGKKAAAQPAVRNQSGQAGAPATAGAEAACDGDCRHCTRSVCVRDEAENAREKSGERVQANVPEDYRDREAASPEEPAIDRRDPGDGGEWLNSGEAGRREPAGEYRNPDDDRDNGGSGVDVPHPKGHDPHFDKHGAKRGKSGHGFSEGRKNGKKHGKGGKSHGHDGKNHHRHHH